MILIEPPRQDPASSPCPVELAAGDVNAVNPDSKTSWILNPGPLAISWAADRGYGLP